jgi:hypothetical protein
MVDRTLIPEDEAARIAEVERYEILDTPADGTFDRITALAARHFDAPIDRGEIENERFCTAHREGG